MIRKICFFFVLLATLSSKTEGFYAEVEPRFGVFYPTAKKFREIYSAINPLYQLEGAFHFGYPWEAIPWKLWVNLSFVSEGGKTIHARHKTGCKIFPISGGLKYSWNFCQNFEFYMGAGATGTYVWLEERCHAGTRHTFKKAAGAVGKTGFRYEICNKIFIDIFCDYYLTYLHIGKEKHCDLRDSLNMSALMFGAGMGVPF